MQRSPQAQRHADLTSSARLVFCYYCTHQYFIFIEQQLHLIIINYICKEYTVNIYGLFGCLCFYLAVIFSSLMTTCAEYFHSGKQAQRPQPTITLQLQQLVLGGACTFHVEPVRCAKSFSWGFWKKEFSFFLCIFLQLFGGNLDDNGGSSEETRLSGKKEEIQSRGYLTFFKQTLVQCSQ